MPTLPEQFSAARKSQVEAQLSFLRTLTSKTFESAEKIIALNISASRASVEKSSAAMRQLIAGEDPSDLFAFTLTTQTQENFGNLLAYGRQLFSIATSLQADLIKPAVAASAPASKPALSPAPTLTVVAAPTLTVVAAPAPAPVTELAKPVKKPAAAVKPAAKAKPAAKTEAKPAAAQKPAPAPFPTASTQAKQMDMLAPKVDKKK